MLTTRPPVLPSGSNHFSQSWLLGAVAPRINFIIIIIFIIIFTTYVIIRIAHSGVSSVNARKTHSTILDASTSGTSRVLTVASLQRLKMEGLIPAPAGCEVWSVIKFLNSESIAPIEIHRQLWQIFGHTRLDGQHISCRSSVWRRLIIIHPIARTSRPVISIFSYIPRNSYPVSVSFSRMTNRRR